MYLQTCMCIYFISQVAELNEKAIEVMMLKFGCIVNLDALEGLTHYSYFNISSNKLDSINCTSSLLPSSGLPHNPLKQVERVSSISSHAFSGDTRLVLQ